MLPEASSSAIGVKTRRGVLPRHRALLFECQLHRALQFLTRVIAFDERLHARRRGRLRGSRPTGFPARSRMGRHPGVAERSARAAPAGGLRSCKGGSSLSASPSMPAATGPSERTSNDGADHCSTRLSPSLAAPAPRTAMPSTPASRRGRVPEAIARPSRYGSLETSTTALVLRSRPSAPVKRRSSAVSTAAEHRRHRLGDRSQLRVAIPLTLDRFGVDTERHVVDEHAAVDLGEVDQLARAPL